MSNKRKYKVLKRLGLGDSEIALFLDHYLILKYAKKRADKLEKIKKKGDKSLWAKKSQ